MDTMTVEYLRYFVEAYHCGSVYQAAKNIHISPQGVSQGIKRLEDSLRLQLFTRKKNRLVPTKFGDMFYPRAAQAVKYLDELEEFANNYRAIGENSISVGLMGYNQFSYLVLSLIQSFQEKNSQAKINATFYEPGQYDMLYKKVKNYELDVAWCFHSDYDDAFTYITLKDQPLKCLISADNKLSKKEFLHWSDLKDEPFVSTGKNEVFPDLIREHCEKFGFVPYEKFFSTDSAFISQLVNKNQAVVLLYENFIDSIRVLCTNTKVMEVRPELHVCQSLFISKDRKRSKILDFFLEYTEINLRNNSEKW
ncbi:MAG: LysR family transcriptional regulator [Clostridiales bacterium]|nr:LysR family transcriptional regulator [Clostridiales bacterium]